jgi:hypothetical protein
LSEIGVKNKCVLHDFTHLSALERNLYQLKICCNANHTTVTTKNSHKSFLLFFVNTEMFLIRNVDLNEIYVSCYVSVYFMTGFKIHVKWGLHWSNTDQTEIHLTTFIVHHQYQIASKCVLVVLEKKHVGS